MNNTENEEDDFNTSDDETENEDIKDNKYYNMSEDKYKQMKVKDINTKYKDDSR